MKKSPALVLLMILSRVAFAQASAHQKVASTVYKAASVTQAGNPIGSTTSRSSNISNAHSATGQLGNAVTAEPANISNPLNDGRGNRRVCRTVGALVYYCL